MNKPLTERDEMQMQPQLPLNDDASYYARRMHALGVMPEINKIKLHNGIYNPDTKQLDYEVPIFWPSPKGIDILVYSLSRYYLRSHKTLKRKSGEVEASDKPYFITRLETPKENQKYDKPAKEPSYPFFPPRLVAEFEKCAAWKDKNPGKPLPDKLRIKSLYLTEGFFKAFKADMHHIWCVGLQSITCLREKETNTIWSDIVLLVTTCECEHLVFLTDGDFMNITSNELRDGIDLYQRPARFYDAAFTFKEIVSSLPGEKYFAHINTDTLPGNPKGLDDLLCGLEDAGEAAMEFNNFSIMAPGKIYPGKYITRINISIDTGKVRQYMHLNDVTQFYLYHVERRPELKDIKNFKFNKSTWRYDEEKGICDVEIPGDAQDYIRAGNDYYKKIISPDAKGNPIKSLEGRNKGTIVDDFGAQFIKHIPKYEKLCIYPNHHNYQPVIHNCYNIYHPFAWEPAEGDCSNTLDFIKHIFGEEIVEYKHPDTGIISRIPRYELGLDYISIAYNSPAQILPILCLTSRERQTSKTTFLFWLDKVFADNTIRIGNEDLEGDFNAHWAGKLFIMVDETKVDSGKVINKIKRLSTENKIVMNAKGKDHTTLSFFAKFILTSNHVEDFIRIDKEEIRFWVIIVPPLKKIIPHFEDILVDEIPAFLNYLQNRKMVSEDRERHWFDTLLLQTKALHDIKENSRPTLEKRIRQELQELFDMLPDEQLNIPLEALCTYILKINKDQKIYCKRTLRDMGVKLEGSKRGSFPRYIETNNTGIGQPATKKISIEWVEFHTSCYVFDRADFAADLPGVNVIASDNEPISNTLDVKLPF